MVFDREKFNCQACRFGRHCDDDYGWPDSKGPAAYPIWIIPKVIETNVCLLPMVTNFSRVMLDMYGHYEKGYLPAGGGMLDQPNAFVEAMQIIDGQMNHLKIERAKKPNG